MNISLWSSLAAKADRIAADALEGVRTRDDWESVRDQRRAELLRGLGLEPLPARCDLKQRDYGSLRRDGFHARKVGYQILPDCWASATFYYPDPLPAGKLPAVLYLCGHAAIGTDHYQAHGIRWARRGYVCLVVDTIEQNDNPGEHHGFNLGLDDLWIALGYSGGGGEVWNSIRALDVLAADPAVDPERLAVTGVSGGGACGFFLAAVDERIRAVASLCGVSTPRDGITHRHLLGHCDCFYPFNHFCRDLGEYAALIAPRPTLFCNADQDPLFHPEEVCAFVERTRRIYALYGREDACALVTAPGPHGDQPAFDDAVAAWFDQHIAGEKRPDISRGSRELSARECAVFDGQPPEPNHLHLLPHLLTTRGTLPLPADAAAWPTLRQATVAKLKRDVFPMIGAHSALIMERDGGWLWGAWNATESERINVVVEKGELEGLPIWLQRVAPTDFTSALVSVAGAGETMQQAMARASTMVDRKKTLYAGLEPRLAAERWMPPQPSTHYAGSRLPSIRTNLTRALALVGATPILMILEDILAALPHLLELKEMEGRPLYLHGRGDAGVAALYATILEERVAGVILEDAPGSHLTGAPLPGILRVLDLPQAAGLVAPRPVALVNPVFSNWTWPARLYQRLECPKRWISAVDARDAMAQMRTL